MISSSESDLEKINEKQKKFLSELLEWRPDFRKFCRAEVSDEGACNLWIEILSPTGEKDRDIFIWVSDGDISLEFGRWHTHVRLLIGTEKKGYYEEYSLIEVVKMIVSNEIVYYAEIGGESSYTNIMNLKNKNAIAMALTEPYSTGRIEIKSWDGTRDRMVTLKDIQV